MEITFIGHASILITANNLRILSDPWWAGPCFGVQWWIYPKPRIEIVEARPVDYIYISHGHDDHFHKATLSRFDRHTVVLLSSTLTELAESIRQMRFPIRLIGPSETADLGNGVKVRIVPVGNGDTIMVLDDGKEISINANDALSGAPPAVRERITGEFLQHYPRIDYLFCCDSPGSHFPNCYSIPGKDDAGTAARRQKQAIAYWCRIVASFGGQLRFAFPFASSVVFLDEGLFELNEAIRNAEQPSELFRREFPASTVQTVDIAPGFSIRDGLIVQDSRRLPVLNAEIRDLYAKDLERLNRYRGPSKADVDALCKALKENISRRQKHLAGFRRDYRLAIKLRGSAYHLQIHKKGKYIDTQVVDRISPNTEVILTTRANYLEISLKKPYGHEIMRVGSGCRLSYSSRQLLAKNLHQELFDAVICADNPVVKRPAGFKYEVKQTAKRLLGRKIDSDHWYDLEKSTVWVD